MQEQSPESKSVAALMRRLDVQAEGDDVYGGDPGRSGPPRLFGGLVAGQAVVAAARTVEGPTLHSLHAYFLQPGVPGVPIEYRVERLKEGKNFHARSVTGRQDGRVIFSMQASFARPEPGFSHQDAMPTVPAPEELPAGGSRFGPIVSPVEMRDALGGFERAAAEGSGAPGSAPRHRCRRTRSCTSP